VKIYLAGPFSARAELNEQAARLIADGHVITSRWLDGDGGHAADGTPEQMDAWAAEDLVDVVSADMLVLWNGSPTGRGRGGRHVEFGAALAWGKDLVVVGPRRNAFEFLAAVRHFADWDAFHAG
jgi:hypothetical protein